MATRPPQQAGQPHQNQASRTNPTELTMLPARPANAPTHKSKPVPGPLGLKPPPTGVTSPTRRSDSVVTASTSKHRRRKSKALRVGDSPNKFKINTDHDFRMWDGAAQKWRVLPYRQKGQARSYELHHQYNQHGAHTPIVSGLLTGTAYYFMIRRHQRQPEIRLDRPILPDHFRRSTHGLNPDRATTRQSATQGPEC